MFFGSHVSIAGGIFNAPINAAKTGSETFQIFTRSPRGGAAPKLTAGITQQFKENCRRLGYTNFYIHTPYYINLASSNPKIAYGSISIIRQELERGSVLGAKALMTHLGSANNLSRSEAIKKVIAGLKKVLTGYKGTTQFLIEMSAGSGNVIGDTFEEIAAILKALKTIDHQLSTETGVCLDTAHAFASGYDLRTPQAVRETLKKFDQTIGLKKLRLIHANDSLAVFNSHVDRHWHIGFGKIGLDCFKTLINDHRLKNIDLILETPDEYGGKWDKKNLAILKKLRAKK